MWIYSEEAGVCCPEARAAIRDVPLPAEPSLLVQANCHLSFIPVFWGPGLSMQAWTYCDPPALASSVPGCAIPWPCRFLFLFHQGCQLIGWCCPQSGQVILPTLLACMLAISGNSPQALAKLLYWSPWCLNLLKLTVGIHCHMTRCLQRQMWRKWNR